MNKAVQALYLRQGPTFYGDAFKFTDFKDVSEPADVEAERATRPENKSSTQPLDLEPEIERRPQQVSFRNDSKRIVSKNRRPTRVETFGLFDKNRETECTCGFFF